MIRFTAWGAEVTYDEGEFVAGDELIRRLLETFLKAYPHDLLLTKEQKANPEISRVEWLASLDNVDIKIIENVPPEVTHHEP